MHRKIGILGGMSPESTITYYEQITRNYTTQFGDYGYPEILIYSVNFQQFVDWQHAGDWGAAARAMSCALRGLHAAGADFGLIATNTMHIVFDQVQAEVPMPLLSIMDATGQAIKDAGIRTLGLLGTVFTMGEVFFREGLNRFGIETIVPDDVSQARINAIIYDELCRGQVRDESRQVLLDIIHELRSHGAQGVILGCTELPLLVHQQDCDIPLFDTTALHARKALEYALETR